MRAPRRKRPMRRAPVLPPDGVDLGEVAANVRYVGSGEQVVPIVRRATEASVRREQVRSEHGRCT
jgi:hypothetical protein